MNLASTLPRSAVAALKSSWWQQRLLDALSRMPRGQLTLRLPDGTQRHFGKVGGASWHTGVRAPAALAIRGVAVIDVHDERFFRRCGLHGDIGFAEAYLDGDWSTPDITAVIAWFLVNLDHAPTLSGTKAGAWGLNVLRILNRWAHRARENTRRMAQRNIREHYDLSNEFFALWLDPSMMYSSARWTAEATDLTTAQRAKNEALCARLQLRSSDHVLEIGTGWGGWAIHAAQRYGCRVTSLTLSPQQRALAQQRIAAAGLADRIEVRLQDYRDLPGDESFDKIVSIEMLEAEGHRYLDAWCRAVARALKPGGVMSLQFIACPDARYDSFRRGVDYIQKHIFPGSLLLSVNRLNAQLSARGGVVLRELEDMGQDYARTLRVWRETFDYRIPQVKTLGFDERFVRKWRYYLSYCEAAFAMRNITVVQTVHTRPNNLSF
jgi:cyclopropane-fatty-acyl-phospholipid synthase